ncbi:MAG: LysR family transcriptional regulator [Thermodesulfobacteriota bacterium]
MNIDQLRTFHKVAETGNFTKAAHALFLTQPAVSQHIQALENFYDLRLFDRTGKKVILTHEGEILLEQTSKLLGRFKEIEDLFEQVNALQRGKLDFGSTAVIATYILPRLLGQFNSMYPEIELDLHMGNTHKVTTMVREGIIDFALSGFHERHPELAKVLIHTERMLVVVAPSHPLAKGKSISPSQLASTPFIWREQGTQTRQSVTSWFSKHVDIKEMPPKFMELESLETAKKVVAEGFGITVLPESGARQEIELGQLRAIELDGFQEEVSFYLTFHKGRHFSRAATEFLAMMATDSRLNHGTNISTLLADKS